MKQKIGSIICILLSIAAMVLPNGVPMVFAASPTQTATEYYSYFSPILFGYGNYFPIITFLLSIIILFLIALPFKKGCSKISATLLMLAAASSILSWLLFQTFSFVGLLVLILHGVTLIMTLAPKGQPISRRFVRR